MSSSVRKLTEYQSDLAGKYLALAISIGSRFAFKKGVEPDEFVGAAILRLCQAASRYRYEKIPFAAYAKWEIKDGVVQYWKWWLRRRRAGVRMMSQLERWDEIESRILTYSVDDKDEFDVIVANRLDCLSPRQQQAINLFLAGSSWSEVAATMGLGRQAIHGLFTRSVGRLKREAGLL